ncbi:MAG: ankyrin repeat domain-containing protein [Endomicrobia bacterium]|nr:ankyrin repeat domain-containing protein [Endomicrobiia bacterium]
MNFFKLIFTCMFFFAANSFAADEDIFRIVKEGDLQKIKAAVNADNINMTDKEGNSVLQTAADAGASGAVLTYLLETEKKAGGSDIFKLLESRERAEDFKDKIKEAAASGGINTRDNKGDTPLLIAVQGLEDAEIIDILIQAGADVNITGSYGIMPLVMTADPQIVELLIKAGADLNEKTANGMTPLMSAASIIPAQPEKIKMLLDAGADAALKDAAGNTALSFAERAGDKRVITLLRNALLEIDELVKEGNLDQLKISVNEKNVNKRNSSGLTPLMVAAGEKNPNLKIIDVLLDAGAQANDKDDEGRTPLIHCLIAVTDENIAAEIVKTLIKNGADINVKDNRGLASLMYAAGFASSAKAVKLLIEAQADVNAKDKENQTALIYAALGGLHIYEDVFFGIDIHKPDRDPEIVKFLAEAGADVNVKTKEGYPLLTEAVMESSPEILDILAKSKGIDLNAKDIAGRIPLMYANAEKMDILIKAGANIDAKYADKKGNTLLMYAVYAGSKSFARSLIKAGAEINAKNKEGRTALMYAANAQMLQILLDSGADFKKGMPFKAASDADMYEILIKAGAKPESMTDVKHSNAISALHAMIYAYPDEIGNEKAHAQAIADLIKMGADINLKDENGDTPLMAALCSFATDTAGKMVNPEAVKVLTANKADPNIANEKGEKPLFYALENVRNIEIIKMLVKAGANVNAVDNEGKTPLMYAAENSLADTANVLIKAGAKLNTKDKNGKTAAMYAAENGLTSRIFNIFVKAGADVKEIYKKDNLNKIMFKTLMRRENGVRNIQALIKAGADVKAKDENGQTILMCAAKNYPEPDIINILIKAGANIKSIDNEGRTVLMYAFMNTYNGLEPETVQILIKAGAEINVKDNEGLTAFLYGSRYALVKNMEALAKKKADINARDNDGKNALMHCARHNSFAMMKFLIKSGVNVKARDNEGKTPLMYAAHYAPSENFMNVLIQAGANIKDKDNQGKRASDYKKEDAAEKTLTIRTVDDVDFDGGNGNYQ